MPSVVAVERKSGRVVAVGGKALSSVGPEVEIIHPFVGGVATNMDAAAGLMRFCFDIARPRQRWRRWLKPRVIIAEPLGFSEEERNAVFKIAERAGWGYTLVLNLGHAASIGAGLPIVEPKGCMIVDVGSVRCEVAVLSHAEIVHSSCARYGGADLDAAIVDYVKRAYGLSIEATEAERVKRMIGTAQPMGPKMRAGVRGHDVEIGMERDMMVTSEEVQRALAPSVSVFVDTVRNVLAQCDSGIMADLGENGIVLSGGSSQLRGLDELLARETGLPVLRAEDPQLATIIGVGLFLERIDVIFDDARG